MKSIILTLIVLAASLFSVQTVTANTGDITGQIIEKETMAPVAYAQVTLDNGTTKTVINANEYGLYSAKHLATGKYNVWVKYDNHVVAMNAIHIKDSYTVGINLIVSANASMVETKELKRENTTGALKQQPDNTRVMPVVLPTQAPVKAPLVQHKQNVDVVLPVNPVKIATKSPMA